MPVKKYKPTSPGRRFMATSDFSEITATEPEKSLTEPLQNHAGRNVKGQITIRHREGRGRRLYRRIDFRRDKFGIPGKVATIEYDPNRTARIALIHYRDGEKRYIVAPLGLRIGDELMSGAEAPVRVGNALPLERIPLGSTIHNLEVTLGRGAQLVRSAGAAAQLLAKEGDYAVIRMPSSGAEARAHPLHGHHRPGRKPRPRERVGWQGRTLALGRQATDGSRFDHEPDRPPARWR